MRQWGNWRLVPGGELLVHLRTGCVVVVTQVRSFGDIRGALEEPCQRALHSSKDIADLAGALIELIHTNGRAVSDGLA